MVPTLLLTRPRESAESFAKAAQWSGRVVISPLLSITLRNVPPPDAHEAVIVTSQHAVRALTATSARRDWPVWCVGPGSLNAAQVAGFANLHDGGGTAQTLFERLCAARPDRPLVHMRGAHVVTDLAGRLNVAGLRARAVVCYDQLARPLSVEARDCLQAPGNVVVPVFSPRSAGLLAQAWHSLTAPQAALHAVAISRAAADALQDVPLAGLHLAETPDQRGMLAILARLQATLEPEQNPR